jgi:hypothetical protein
VLLVLVLKVDSLKQHKTEPLNVLTIVQLDSTLTLPQKNVSLAELNAEDAQEKNV